MKKLLLSMYTMALVVPMFALAQFNEIDDFLGDISKFINNVLIPLLFAIALLFFLYGAFNYFIQGGKGYEDKKEEGKQYMIWAIIGFVLMVSVFGIVNLIANGLGFADDEELDNIPNVPTSNR